MSTKLVHTNGYLGKDTGKHPVWVEAQEQEQPFVITLTPTESDLSGTMDKTPAEIWEAYKAGRRFEFYIPEIGNGRISVVQTMELDADNDTGYDCVVLQSNIIYIPADTSFLISIRTGIENTNYFTSIYTLTPVE